MSHIGMSHADYLSNKAYGSSDITKMAKSFAYWKWHKENPQKPGRALIIGSATHTMLQANVTKNESLFNDIKVYEEGSSLTNGFKKFQSDNPTAYCLDQKEFMQATAMVKALLSDSEVMGYLNGALVEPTILTTYADTNVKVKCRPDYLHMDRAVSINLKTTTDATESGFIYSTKEYAYDWQSAFYIDLLSKTYNKPFDEVHILVEKPEEGEPVSIKIFSFDDSTIGWARAQIAEVMARIPECEKTGIWPKNLSKLETVTMPLYARKIAFA